MKNYIHDRAMLRLLEAIVITISSSLLSDKLSLFFLSSTLSDWVSSWLSIWLWSWLSLYFIQWKKFSLCCCCSRCCCYSCIFLSFCNHLCKYDLIFWNLPIDWYTEYLCCLVNWNLCHFVFFFAASSVRACTCAHIIILPSLCKREGRQETRERRCRWENMKRKWNNSQPREEGGIEDDLQREELLLEVIFVVVVVVVVVFFLFIFFFSRLSATFSRLTTCVIRRIWTSRA